MAALSRGTCPVCGRAVALRKGELVREHRARRVNRRGRLALDPKPCTGSGKKVWP